MEEVVIIDVVIIGLVLCGSASLTGLVRRYAIRNHLMDHPNSRSSHSIPTPRGGGLGIVVTFTLALIYFVLSNQLEVKIFLALAGGGGLVAVIAYWDDHQSLSVKTRIPGYFVAAVWATMWINGIPHLDMGVTIWNWGWLGHIVSILGIMWLLNLYNFMDGIDGFASSEAIFASGIGGILLLEAGEKGLGLTSLALAAACVGFLSWNWPPAKIFMGDVGSIFLGYVLGVLAIVSDQKSDVSLWIWLILLSVFIVDATVTLLRRLLQGEKVYEAHRSHAYQHATTVVDSHLKVTLSVIGINLLILVPLALIALNWPKASLLAAGTAIKLLTITALHFDAGIETKKEDDNST